jgi:cytochrome c oxidase subunit 3
MLMAKTKVRSRLHLYGEGVGDVPPPRRFGGGGEGEQPFDAVSAVRWGVVMFLVAITMMFGALAVIYLLRLPVRAAFPFELPRLSWVSTAVILISSISMQYALHAARHQNRLGLCRGLGITFALGCLFLTLQLLSWLIVKRSASEGIFTGLFYLFTGLHGAHLLGGVIFLAYLFYRALRDTGLLSNPLLVEMGTLYWHFLGALWVALFILMQVR